MFMPNGKLTMFHNEMLKKTVQILEGFQVIDKLCLRPEVRWKLTLVAFLYIHYVMYCQLHNARHQLCVMLEFTMRSLAFQLPQCSSMCSQIYNNNRYTLPLLCSDYFRNFFFAVHCVMSICYKEGFVCCDKLLHRKRGGPKNRPMVRNFQGSSIKWGMHAAGKPVWNSLIKQGTHWKKCAIQNRDGGVGDGERGC